MRHPYRPPRGPYPVRARMYLKPWYLLATLRDQFRLCRCAHDRRAHTHYRRGTDCARCACSRWSRKMFRTWRIT